MKKIIFLSIIAALVFNYTDAHSSLHDGEIIVQGEQDNLRGVSTLEVECTIRGTNFYLTGRENPELTIDNVKLSVTHQLEKAGITVNESAPTALIVEFDTPGGTLMTYVNFIVVNKARGEVIWMATGYDRGKVYPEPVERLTRRMLLQWTEANDKALDIPAEKKRSIIVITLLPGRQFSINDKRYPYQELINVLKAFPPIECDVVKVQSDWNTRSEMGSIYKLLVDSGFNAKIDYQSGEGGEQEKQFLEEWNNIK